ncbi:MAG: transporter substrate-binding domain-containing protein, partial [Paracoccaceae bacterium]|nr:transporter substrate-binding domain-containing protein [Paracoccaceae bacterium]
MKKNMILFAAVISALSFSLPAVAGAGDSPTLKRIQDSGTVNIGHRETSIPFSYIGANNEPEGYSIDLCHKIVDAIKEELGVSSLDINYVPVTGQTRIPLIANG